MITNIKLGNIRVFEDVDRWDFPLTRINVLCGTNSAGKSTILKCLLLLLQSNDVTDLNATSGLLMLSGPLVDLGSYKTFVSHKDVRRDIYISITFTDLVESRRLGMLREVRKHPQVNGVEEEFVGYTLECGFTFGLLRRKRNNKEADESLPFTAGDPPIDSLTTQAYLKEATFRCETEDELKFDWSIKLRTLDLEKGKDPEYDIFMPADYFGASGGRTVMEVATSEKTGEIMAEALVRGILPSGIWSKPKRVSKSEYGDQLQYFPLPPLIRSLSSDITETLKEIHYMGPLRSPAKRYYIASSDASPAMDSAGEFLPYVLRDRGDTEVDYFSPGANIPSRRPLRDAVDEWLFYLRTGTYRARTADGLNHEIDFTSVKDVLLEFTLQSFSEETHALADSGFGYSQVLPIVVRGLVAGFDETIAIEQPELHLNPALQVRLAEFLIALAKSSKSLIIETHSEHIVNALRVFAAEDVSGSISEDCSILYLDVGSGVPMVYQLEVKPDGTVPEWPRSFMGEALHLSSRLLKAQQLLRTAHQGSE